MKTVNGGLLIVIAFFVLWIGVTGRFPRLIAAIGLVRGVGPKSGEFGAGDPRNFKVTSSVPLMKEEKPNALNMPLLSIWQDALKSMPGDVGP